VGVCGEYGAYVCSGHVASISGGVHDFVEVTNGDLCGMGFEGKESVT
jgi:hypothetical protein